MSSTPDDKPQRATAAQLASRRIKDLRRRRPNPTAPGAAAASFGGPFSSLDPNTVSSTSAGSQPMTNSFAFGQSQSFPGAGSSPKPPTENGGTPFAFGAGGAGAGGSSSFNFSASFGNTASTSGNPFAGMPTGSTSQQPDGASFSGFKGNLFNVPPSASQPPAQQPLPSGGLFGSGSQQSNISGGVFGTTTAGGPSAQPATAPPTTGSIFGQSSTNAPAINVFGQSGPDKPTPFAQSTAFGDDSMQTSPDAKATAPKASIFGTGNSSESGFGGGNLFGSTASATTETSSSKPLFGTKISEQPTPLSTSLFGGPIQPSSSTPAASSSTPAPATTTTTNASSSSLFAPSALAKSDAPFQNPFKSANLFSSPTVAQKPAAEGKKEETQVSEPPQPQSGIQFTSTNAGNSLFPKGTGAASESSNLFQSPSAGSLFSPKATTTSTEQAKPKPADANPFSSLFSPKPPTSDEPKAEHKQPSFPLSNNIFTPKPNITSEGPSAKETPKSAASIPTLFASSPAKPTTTPAAQPNFAAPAARQNAPASPFTFGAPSQGPAKVNGEKTAPLALSNPSTAETPSQRFETMQPAKMPSDLDKDSKEEVEMLYRVRLLNECFRREVSKLDPATESFDAALQFYMRVRETIGAPLETVRYKRKTSDTEQATTDTQPAKKVKSFGGSSSVPALTAPSSIVGTPFQLSGASQSTPSNKRKSAEDSNDDSTFTSQPQKRVNGDSTTASIFANSFSKSKTSDSGDEPSRIASTSKLDALSFKPATPEAGKAASFSTTPTSSPTKPLYATSVAPKESSTCFSQSSSKPSFTTSTNSTAPTNPFVLKPSGDGSSTGSAPSISIPKFASGPTNFFAQFKAQTDKDAEKEKAKRKAEDFDSDEDDEAEWERKDAENQRKKMEEIEAQKGRRTKFVPGQGFSFEEEDATEEIKKDGGAGSNVGASIFDTKNKGSTQSNNIFGHLSATPSETEETGHDDDADDTEEASVDGDDATKDPSFVPTSEDEDSQNTGVGSVNISSIVGESFGQESSDDGDLAKALKRSKQASSETATKEHSGRSLFDRVEYDQEGKPKRQGEGEGLSTFFNSSKYASSFNSPASTPNPFAPTNQAQPDKAEDSSASKVAPANIFGASNTAGNIFGSPAPTPSGAKTPSIFAAGASATKSPADNTWKINSPIKFAPDSAGASSSKPDSGSGTSAPDSSKPFSTLFGAPPSGSKSNSNDSQPSLGFSFGAPSHQQAPSFLTPSALNSATPSRASTPGVTSDTGAEESGDADGTESLPQVNLARSGAGEENEDIVMEVRARAMKLNAGVGWESQGLGFLRILKDRTTSRSRALLRADPSGKVVLNTALMKAVSYTVSGNSVQFLVPKAGSPPEQWALRVKKEEVEKLGSSMEEAKA